MPALEVESLTVQYGGVMAVSDVSLQVATGAIVGLIGPNGAGKTSVIDAITGFAVAHGEVRLAGVDVARPASARPGAGRHGAERSSPSSSTTISPSRRT